MSLQYCNMASRASIFLAFLLVCAVAASPDTGDHGDDHDQHDGHAHDDDCKTVAEIAADTPALSTLLAAVQAVNLTGILSDEELVATVFAPTNDAFVALLKTLNLTAAELLAQPDLVTQVLQYHVVPDVAANSTSLYDDQVLYTLLGQQLMVNLTASGVDIVTEQGAVSTVVTADVQACDAIVHVIDVVLVPDLDALSAQGV